MGLFVQLEGLEAQPKAPGRGWFDTAGCDAVPVGPKPAQCDTLQGNSLGVTSGDHSAPAEMLLLPARVTDSGKELCSSAAGGFGQWILWHFSAPATVAVLLPLGIPCHTVMMLEEFSRGPCRKVNFKVSLQVL